MNYHRIFMKLRFAASMLLGFCSLSPVLAATPAVELVIQHQQFAVQELPIQANTKIRLVIINHDDLPAEFESYDLSREVVVPGHSSVTIYIGPLDPGRYRFFNDFNHAAQGWVVVATPNTGH
ncbi:MAG: cupredoxin domain-containing protein [Gammaproteobacteria bacterium]|nr:cupredoxin domain-containing protein [Gammaproteobacteria bacterium]MDE2344945.1 cupredoxin domain-containing protein [Gammaproteobacteria bacterium]